MGYDRRTFIKTGAALVAGTATGCATSQSDAGALKTSSDALLRGAVDSGDVPGVVAAVTTRDSAIYEGAFGVRVLGQVPAMSMDTVMWIASMT